ncbi:hypothetical protein [Pseudomonas sp. RGM2987]|uniref:hypothetical protein n=1 Tax=Pseudomonas sp. RGM2987 TaxID=2930090 RepID=UPI001FD70AA4|nr:hypothetical protein [Pseudomonas sp. RGM2987]MCJ8205015.1 hypothetical protein [Pseudomonas sp. RGM2987]
MPSLDTLAPARADAWHPANPHCHVQYRLLAETEPDLLCRALNLFALQGLIPRQVHVERHDDLLSMDIGVDGVSWHRAQVIAEKLRNLISVCSVELQAADIARVAPVLAAG